MLEHRYPDAAYAALARAQKALAEWKMEHPEKAEAIAEARRTERQKAEAARQERYESSFVARGID